MRRVWYAGEVRGRAALALGVVVAGLIGGCRRRPEVIKPAPASESAAASAVSSSAVGDGSVDDAPKRVSADFDGITRVEAVDGNIVGHHPTRGLLWLTNSGVDSEPALSADGRVAFARWVTTDCAPPDEPNVSCSELWLLTSKGSPTRLLDKGLQKDRPAIDLPNGAIGSLTFSRDGRTLFMNDSGFGTVGSLSAWAYDLGTKRLSALMGAGRFVREVTSGPWSGAAIVCGMPLQPAPDYGRKEECRVVRADASARRTLSVDSSKWSAELGEK